MNKNTKSAFDVLRHEKRNTFFWMGASLAMLAALVVQSLAKRGGAA